MKKALVYTLSLALILSLAACHKPKAEQPTDPAPSTLAPVDTSTQGPAATPEPIKDTVPETVENTTPELEPEQTPAAPVETKDTQTPEETALEAQEEPTEQPPEDTPQTTEPTTQMTSEGGDIATSQTQQQTLPSSYEDDLTPEEYAEIERQLREQYIQSGGNLTDSGREGQISASEEEYIGTILNGGGAQYNP